MGLPKFGEKFALGWLNSLESRQSQFEKLENEESRSNRYEDTLDRVETVVLNLSTVRVEHRWSEIERIRALFYWYPFYPKTFSGESADDCCDPDRLIGYDDDLRFMLFNVVNSSAEEVHSDFYKFKLFCSFLKLFNALTWDNTNGDSSFDDEEFARYLSEQLPYLNSGHAGCVEDTPCNGNSDFFRTLFSQLSATADFYARYAEEERDFVRQACRLMCKNTIEYVRNCFAQIVDSFKTLDFKTNVVILKWRFELHLLELIKKTASSIGIWVFHN